MPMTAAEKQRKYRERMKNNEPEKYKDMRKKAAEMALQYYRNKIANYTEEQKEEQRRKWKEERKKMPVTAAEKQRKYRERLKNNDPEKYKKMLKKPADKALIYYRNKTANYTEEQKENLRRKWKEERERAKQLAICFRKLTCQEATKTETNEEGKLEKFYVPMPMTPAEKQRKYRERMKNNEPEKYRDMQRKNALKHYRNKLENYTEEQRRKWKEERKKSSNAQSATYPSTSKEDETKGNADEDSDDDKKLNELQSRVTTLEQQSKDYDIIFQEFGEKVVKRLKSIPIESAILLQKRLEDVMNEFCSTLYQFTASDATRNTDAQTKISKNRKILPKGSAPKKKSSSKNIAVPSTSSSKLAKVKAKVPSAQVVTDLSNKYFTVSLVTANQGDVELDSKPQIHESLDTTETYINYGDNPKSHLITVPNTTSSQPAKRQYPESDSSQVQTAKQARANDEDDFDEIEIKIEPEEVVVKIEYQSDDENYPFKNV